ncbi:MAG: DUF3850 domain-containing protein [Pseudomonadota bacterium]
MKTQQLRLHSAATAVARVFTEAERMTGKPFPLSYKSRGGATEPNGLYVPVVLLRGLVEVLSDQPPADETLDGRRCHDLKVWSMYWGALASGDKPFDVRLNDRDYQVGDLLRMRDYNQATGTYTGLELWREITYILLNDLFCKPGHVVLGLRAIAPRVAVEATGSLDTSEREASDQYSGR